MKKPLETRGSGVPRQGLETVLDSPEKTRLSDAGGAESGAVGAPMAEAGDDLNWLCRAWPTLPSDVQVEIVALAKNSVGT